MTAAGAGTAGRTSRWFRLASPVTALVLGGLVLLLAVALIPLSIIAHQNPFEATGVGLGIAVPFAVVGTVVARRLPRNPIGWLMLAPSVLFLLGIVAAAYDVIDYRLGGHLPGGPVAVMLYQSWAPLLALLPLVVLLFPDGRLPSPRWRWPLRAYVALGLAFTASLSALAAVTMIEHGIHVDAIGQLTVFDRGSGAGPGATAVTFLLFLGFWVSFAARQVVSWRRATGDRRQQYKWLMSGGGICALFLVGSVIIGGRQGIWHVVSGILTVGLVALPVGIGVGILKFRLYEIDRIISRTLAYAIVTGLLIGLYAGLVLLATRVLAFQTPVAVAGSTLAAAALFTPVRRRVQRIVDRRFNRARYDADRTIAVLAGRLQDAVDLDTVRADLLTAVYQALEPAHASVWLAGGQP
jgi:hypothetical protein